MREFCAMKILLCAATELEINPTVTLISARQKMNLDVLITGVGLMASTFALTKSGAAKNYDLLIQAGIAGTLVEDETLGKVVAVQTETVGDSGVQEKEGFRSLIALNLLAADEFPWKKQKLLNENSILSTCGLPLVDAVTVNEISTSQERIAYYRHTLAAQVESMEGAALHYVGLMMNVPFLQIRSLSNFTGERDKAKWKMKEAISNLNAALQRILLNL